MADCESHKNVKTAGYCPVCLLNERDRLRTHLDGIRETLVATEVPAPAYGMYSFLPSAVGVMAGLLKDARAELDKERERVKTLQHSLGYGKRPIRWRICRTTGANQ